MKTYEKKTYRGQALALFAAVAMIVCAFALIMPAEESDAASTSVNGTTYISGDVTSTQKYNSATNVVVNDDLTIPAGMALIIEGTFTVNSGATITIEAGGQLIFNSTKAVTINGNIVADGAVEKTTNGYTAAIVNNMSYSLADAKVGLFVNGTITLKNGAEMVADDEETETSVGYSTTADSVKYKPENTAGAMVLSSGSSVEVQKKSSNVSAIEGQTIYLNEGATFKLNGYSNEVTVRAIGSASYFTAGSASIGNTKEGNLSGNRASSDLTFTVTTQTSSAFVGNNDDAKKVTLRQYILNVDGTVNGAVGSNDELIYSDELVVGVGYCYNKENAISNKYYTVGSNGKADEAIIPMSSITGNLVVSGNGSAKVASGAYLVVSGTSTVKYNEKAWGEGKNFTANFTIGGTLYVTGTSTVENGYSIGKVDGEVSAGYGRIIIDGGKVDILKYESKCVEGLYVYAGYYETERDSEGTDMHYRNFDVAVSEATAAGVDEVWVYAYLDKSASKYSEAIDAGAYIVDTDVIIPDGMTLVIGTYLAITEGHSITFSEDAIVDFKYTALVDKSLFVNGKLIDKGGVFDKIAESCVVYEVKKVSEDELVTTYTTLKTAIDEAQAGETINLHGEITVTKDMTIPADVTVVADDEGIIVKGATLTVDGVLDMKESTIGLENASSKVGVVVVNNFIANVADMNMGGDQDGEVIGIPGAFFIGTIGDYKEVNLIASAAVAGANSSTTDEIKVYGKLTMGDVTFTQGEDKTELKVTIYKDVNGNVKLVGTKVLIDIDDSASYTGTISADVTSGTSAVTFSKSAGIDLVIDNTDDGLSVTTFMVMNGVLKGTATVSSGTVQAGTSLSVGGYDTEAKSAHILTIGSGATLLVTGSGVVTIQDNAADKEYAGLVVDGTITVEKKGTLRIADTEDGSNPGYVKINGDANINDATEFGGRVDVLGSMTIADKVNASFENVYVGDSKGTASTLSGKITTSGFIVVYAGANVSGVIINENDGKTNADVTAYYINGNLYMTSYAAINAGVVLADIVPSEIKLTGYETIVLEEAKPTGTDKNSWYSDESMTTLVYGNEEVSGVSAVYAKAELSQAQIYVSVGSNMSVYIDDVRYSNGAFLMLDVGQHKINVQVNPGYSGETSVLFNGVAVNGGTFEVTADMADSTEPNEQVSDSIVLSATGNLAVDIPNTGNGGSTSSSDDGMGLTDILLIVLVVLIAVMAVMVALRMMRS